MYSLMWGEDVGERSAIGANFISGSTYSEMDQLLVWWQRILASEWGLVKFLDVFFGELRHSFSLLYLLMKN